MLIRCQSSEAFISHSRFLRVDKDDFGLMLQVNEVEERRMEK